MEDVERGLLLSLRPVGPSGFALPGFVLVEGLKAAQLLHAYEKTPPGHYVPEEHLPTLYVLLPRHAEEGEWPEGEDLPRPPRRGSEKARSALWRFSAALVEDVEAFKARAKEEALYDDRFFPLHALRKEKALGVYGVLKALEEVAYFVLDEEKASLLARLLEGAPLEDLPRPPI